MENVVDWFMFIEISLDGMLTKAKQDVLVVEKEANG